MGRMTMGSEIIMALVGVLCTAISSAVTFFFTRRKYNTEVDSQQIHNMGESFDVYKKMMEEALASQKKTFEAATEVQDKKIDMLQKEKDSLQAQVSQLQQQMLNVLGSICLDSTCKLRRMNFTSDLRVSDLGVSIAQPQ
jgi:peptidoglycan hydrolase CwlO-like protein